MVFCNAVVLHILPKNP